LAQWPQDGQSSREQQISITHVPERTQRHYCQVARIHRHSNIAIGERYTKEAVEQQAWQRGRGFEFVDYLGRQGAVSKRYVAWQLPNSYEGPHSQTNKGRMRKTNRKLKDLVNEGAQGNDGGQVEKLYHANGGEAAKVFNRGVANDVFWPAISTAGQVKLWHVFCVS
jgi:hypothetical protein